MLIMFFHLLKTQREQLYLSGVNHVVLFQSSYLFYNFRVGKPHWLWGFGIESA
ncbi:23037_t:CDS:2, partial [Dentiscutata erythropus]